MNRSAANPTQRPVGATLGPNSSRDDGVSAEVTDALTELTDRVAANITLCDLNWEPPTSFALRLKAGSEPDFIVRDHGPVWTFRARSQAAQFWWVEHVEYGPCLGRNWVVQHRYAQDLLDGLQRGGFTAVTGRAR
jgi:hypothetical protein